jgi:hypothetical protein
LSKITAWTTSGEGKSSGSDFTLRMLRATASIFDNRSGWAWPEST